MSLPALDNLVVAKQLKVEPRNDAELARMLAMLRWHGYRSENRHIVFQCLELTLGWPPARWRVFSNALQKRNLAEYEGYLEIDETGLEELRRMADKLIDDAHAWIAAPPGHR